MRKVNPKYPVPNEIKYSNIDAEVRDIQLPTNPPKDSIYKGTTKVGKKKINKVSLALKEKYKSKCGYCEIYESDPQVEHHRPKTFVTYGVGFPKSETNNGYHWLAYEWTNMVAACARCNSRKYKGTKFPVDVPGNKRRLLLIGRSQPVFHSDYRYKSTFLESEKPLILHPEYCLPSRHFEFERNGIIKGKTIRGKKSIEVYGLNDETTVTHRLEIYNRHKDAMYRLIKKRWRKTNPKTREYLKEELGDLYSEIIVRANNDRKSFTLYTKDLYKRFEFHFIQPIPNKIVRDEIRDILKEILLELT